MTLFISDTHLGNKHCQADRLCELLTEYVNKEEVLFLVGDIIDDHQMKKWPSSHQYALRLMFEFKSVIYLPGNHDKFFRRLSGRFGNVYVTNRWVFETEDKKKYLIVHGDKFDFWIKYTKYISLSWFTELSRLFEYLHTKITSSNDSYRNRIIEECKRIDVDGVVCGHNHYAENREHLGVHYVNCGDWYNSCTAVVETRGIFRIVSY